MAKPFKNVSALKPRRSVFDLSYKKLLSVDMGLLYPVLCEEVVPGDSWSIAANVVARAMPLIAPLLHEISIYVHYYFVPYRLLWTLWEQFITGGKDGTDSSVLPRMPYPGDVAFDAGTSLWDQFGFPKSPTGTVTATTTLPMDFPRRAYSFIWDQYYRDENLQTELGTSYSDVLLRHAWRKDYFTSALPWAQRGVAPAMPITGTAPVSGIGAHVYDFTRLLPNAQGEPDTKMFLGSVANTTVVADGTVAQTTSKMWSGEESGQVGSVGWTDADDAASTLEADLSGATTFNINDLRLAAQIQRFMERNARCGVRYTEFLHGVFSESPKDERLMRPEYIGGFQAPVIISEVLQTSETTVDHPQGNLAGHGISVAMQKAAHYHATEYGLIMGLMSVRPEPMYSQGINRQWLRRSRYDFYFPQFAHLGEQAVEEAELYWQDTDVLNQTVFGFQGRYDELRYKPNMTVGMLRPGADFDYWTLTRAFASAPELNEDFIKCEPDPRAWAVQVDAPQFVVSFGNIVKAVRPLPIVSEPGRVDHD